MTIKDKLKNIIDSGAAFAIMSGCATMDEQEENQSVPTTILSEELKTNTEYTEYEKRSFMWALKNVRDQEEEKYKDKDQRETMMKCFDACGGIYIKKGKEYSYIPSKYDYNSEAKLCFCNGQKKINPENEIDEFGVLVQACDRVCEKHSTDKIKYKSDDIQTWKQKQCVCKIAEEKQH